ncbi:transcriptional pleiotropic regulator of transition state genes [Hydrogenispora ethanolica]|jgi:transcriptional pleiotropic regulator of transition state genes|uniref:Transcriptional pleiotropic regulator of transition state genes n=1 Tax=Hydrogenispora ethanolica TaxID=1082276 RepID=A0A4R1S0F9_HYDET|nr:AbrB/MazE/SpoVT family DNA-binding domain-containing protein [Hydrogenispora ethanolica]TCL72399.1 transcriptional pleiotropic regulator of transition state genes [Hydrogenispora ethanolica]
MMRPIGIVRKVDCLGRVVIPSELRRNMNIEDADSLEIYVDRDMIVIKKYEPFCVFCGSPEGVENVRGKNICESCRRALRELVSS